MNNMIDVAVVGATGAVGEAMIAILAERNFPVGKLYPLASERSAGSRVEFNGRYERVGVLGSLRPQILDVKVEHRAKRTRKRLLPNERSKRIVHRRHCLDQ